MIFNPESECATQEALEAVQTARLKALVGRVHERVPFYRKAFDAAGVKPDDIHHIRDICLQRIVFILWNGRFCNGIHYCHREITISLYGLLHLGRDIQVSRLIEFI